MITVPKHRRAVNRDTYKQYCAEQERFFEREVAANAHVTRLIGAARGLGQMYAEFGDREAAKPWLDRAIQLMRQLRTEPSLAIAHLYWRSGDLTGLEAECRRVIEHHRRALSAEDVPDTGAAEALAYEKRRALGLAALAVAGSWLYLRDFSLARQAAMHAEHAYAAFVTPEATIVRGLATALEQRDPAAYEVALRMARSRADPWPTFESDSAIELYRLGIAYAAEYFGSLPTDLAQELLA